MIHTVLYYFNFKQIVLYLSSRITLAYIYVVLLVSTLTLVLSAVGAGGARLESRGGSVRDGGPPALHAAHGQQLAQGTHHQAESPERASRHTRQSMDDASCHFVYRRDYRIEYFFILAFAKKIHIINI